MCSGDTLPAALTGCAWVAIIERAYHHDVGARNSDSDTSPAAHMGRARVAIILSRGIALAD